MLLLRSSHTIKYSVTALNVPLVQQIHWLAAAGDINPFLQRFVIAQFDS